MLLKTLIFTTALLAADVFAQNQTLFDKVLIEHIETRIENGAYVGVIVGLIDDGKVTIQCFGEI